MKSPSVIAVRAGVVVLTVSTALIHFWQAFLFLIPDVLFILNGIGYLGLLGALYLPIPRLSEYRHITRFVLIGYTALTIVLWFVITGGFGTAIAYTDKVIEAVLIALLFVDAALSRRRT